MTDARAEITDVLRTRILRGLHGGSLRHGDRLPSARELAGEFDTDHRLVLEAYRVLADERLVEMRQRGGIYVAVDGTPGEIPLPSDLWLTEVLAQGVSREIPLPELHEWLRRSVETLRLRAVAIQTTEDQIAGLCRELQDDYGLEASGVYLASITGDAIPPELRAADLLVTTSGLEESVRRIAERLGKPMIVAEVRADLLGGEWRLLLQRPVYVIVRDQPFVETILRFFADVPGVENLRPLVLGRDDLSSIPPDASVYITASARAHLGAERLPGRILPSARLFSARSSREIIRFIVSANLDVLAARRSR